MRRGVLLVVTTALLATVLGAFAPVAHSSCAAPSITVQPERAFAGDKIAVHGESWTGDCNDVITCTSACSGERCTGGGPAKPATGIALILRPRGDTQGTDHELLAGIDATDQLTFDVTVTVPGLAPGSYELVGISADTGEQPGTPVTIK
jgi:hypothetical protein